MWVLAAMAMKTVCDECGRRGWGRRFLPVLFLLRFIQFNRVAFPNSNSSPYPLLPALVGLLALNSPPPPGRGMCGRRAYSPSAGVRAVCLRRSCFVPLSRYRSFALPRRSPRCCFFSSGVSSPVACLAEAMSSRRASSLPPGSRACPLVRGGLRFASCFRACPSSVIRLMWLVVPSCGGFHCACLLACLPVVSSARCRYMPVMFRYAPRPVLACRDAGRVVAVAVIVSLVGDLLVLLRGRRLVRSVSLRGG